MKRLERYLFGACLILLLVLLGQRYCLLQLEQELKEQKEQMLALELLLAQTNQEYDELWADYLANFKLIQMSPILQLEWDLKYAPNQVRGIDGKFPRER